MKKMMRPCRVSLAICLVCAKPSSCAFSSPIHRIRPLFVRSRVRVGATEGADNVDLFANEVPLHQSKALKEKMAKKRKQPFPRQSYPLCEDEENLKHHFISFIDQSIISSYSQTVRLVEPRLYARPEQFLKENAHIPPTIEDAVEPKSLYGKIATFFAWNGLPARIVVGSMAYMVFPYIISFLRTATKAVEHDDLVSLVGTFSPGISIVLGTYVSLTLSILYNRFSKLQEVVNLEAGLLALTCNNLIHLFHDDQEAAVEGVQCVADQVRTMVFNSRGKETMMVIYNDPYARILKLLKEHDQDESKDLQLLGNLHNAVKDLFTLRSQRISYEGLALNPMHFDLMTFLCGMLMLGFALGTVATAQTRGVPVTLANILFAALVVCYTIIYEMSFDLNRPFDGVYQLRRSGAAMHFLHIKHLICNHPLVAGLVDFEEVMDKDEEYVGSSPTRKREIFYN